MTATPMTTKLIDDMLHGAGIPRCDAWEKLVRHSRALETSVYRGISDLDHVEAERDGLSAQVKDLREALEAVLDSATPKAEREAIDSARALLTRSTDRR